MQNNKFKKFQKDLNAKIIEFNKTIENITKDCGMNQNEVPKMEQVQILNYKDLIGKEGDNKNATGKIYINDKYKALSEKLFDFELIKKMSDHKTAKSQAISNEVLFALKDGQCSAWVGLDFWNERQKDINNTRENPTGVMYDVLNSLVKQYYPKKVDGINISHEYKDKELDRELQMILNYVVAIQKPLTDSIKQLKDAAENEEKNHKETIIVYDKNLFNIGAARQDLRLVDPSGATDEPFLRAIFNQNKEDYSLDDFEHLIHPGVLINLGTKTIHKDGRVGAHAMSCYMDKNENILFYDPNIGEKLTFTDVKNLIAYLRDEHKNKYKPAQIFPDDECRPRIWNVNSDPLLQKEIEKGYNNIKTLLNDAKLDDDEISKKSQELRALCKEEVTQAAANWPKIEKKFQEDRKSAASKVAASRVETKKRIQDLINEKLIAPEDLKKLSKDLDAIKQDLQNQQNKIASNEKIQNPRSKNYSNLRSAT
ncbi:MAG: hypothetical protein K9G11_02390 [Rickettsiaceae bacterium]|nr:hypothetical protein [Rickettsiaceae bacterium]